MTFTLPPFASYYQHYFLDDQSDPGSIKIRPEAISLDNDFIPYHALLTGKVLEKDGKKAMVYYPSITADNSLAIRNYEGFFSHLANGNRWYRLIKKTITGDYRVRAGQIVVFKPNNTVIILATLAVNVSHLYSVNKSEPDYSKFFLIVNNEFANDPEHSNMYKAFKKYYMDKAMEKVSVIHTKDIYNLLYKPLIVKPKVAKSIAEMKQNMAEFHKCVLAVAVNS